MGKLTSRTLLRVACCRSLPPSGREFYLVAIGLILLTAVVYSQVVGFGFIGYDDPVFVTGCPHVKAGLTWEGARWAFATSEGEFKMPLVWLSLMADTNVVHLLSAHGIHLGPRDAGVYHLTNLLLHIGSTLLLFAALRRATRATWPSALVAALFAIHPLHVESVAWVAERKDTLSAFFWMLTMWAYTRYVERPGPRWYVVSLCFFAAGLLAKPMLVTLPFVMLLLDVWPLGRLRSDSLRKLVWEKLPFIVLCAIVGVTTIIIRSEAGGLGSITRNPLSARVANAAVSYAAYLRQTVWPTALSPHYADPMAGLPTWQVIASCALLAAFTCLALRAARTRGYVAVGWLWYLVTLLPVSGLLPVGNFGRADRFTYIPSIGLYVAVAWALHEMTAGWVKRAAVGVAVLAVGAFAVVAHVQVGYWRSTASLFSYALTVDPNDPLAHLNLGCALGARGRHIEAARHWRAALRLDPTSTKAHNNLAIHYARNGRYTEAIRHYRATLRLEPSNLTANNGLGLILERQGKIRGAMLQFRRTIKLAPTFPEGHYNLARLLQRQGRTAEAKRHYEQAVRNWPNHWRAHYQLGVLLADQGRLDEAAAHYREVIRVKPRHALALYNLARALFQTHDLNGAATYFRRTLRVDPKNAQAHGNLGVVLGQQGDLTGAIEHFRAAVALDPNYTMARENLAMALKMAGQGH